MFDRAYHFAANTTSIIYFSEDSDPYSATGFLVESSHLKSNYMHSQIADLPEGTIGRYIHVLVDSPEEISIQELMCW